VPPLLEAGTIILAIITNLSSFDPKRAEVIGVIAMGIGLVMAFAPGTIYWLGKGYFPY